MAEIGDVVATHGWRVVEFMASQGFSADGESTVDIVGLHITVEPRPGRPETLVFCLTSREARTVAAMLAETIAMIEKEQP